MQTPDSMERVALSSAWFPCRCADDDAFSKTKTCRTAVRHLVRRQSRFKRASAQTLRQPANCPTLSCMSVVKTLHSLHHPIIFPVFISLLLFHRITISYTCCVLHTLAILTPHFYQISFLFFIFLIIVALVNNQFSPLIKQSKINRSTNFSSILMNDFDGAINMLSKSLIRS